MIDSVKECLEQFSYEEGAKMVVISMFNDPAINQKIDLFCDSLNVFHRYSDYIQIPENQINGAGHFNEKGNYKLGSFIAEAFFSYKQTSQNTMPVYKSNK